MPPGGVAPDGSLAIESPLDGALLQSRSVRVTGRADNVDLVIVNGTEVEVVDGHFALDLTLVEGEQQIEAIAEETTASITVRVDITPPQIVVEAPGPGAFISGTSLEVRGRVIDATSPTLTLDDEPVEVTGDGRFHVTRTVEPGAVRMRLHATDEVGNEAYAGVAAIVGEFSPPGTPVASAAALQLGSAAIDELERGATDVLGHMDIATLAREENPVATGTWGEIRVDDVHYTGVAVTFEPHAGSIHANVAVTGLRVDLSYDPPLLPVVHGNIQATTANIAATLRLGATDGRVTVSYDDSSVTLDGFSYDIRGVPAFIEGLVNTQVRDYVTRKLNETVEGILPDFLEGAIQDIPSRQIITVVGHPMVVQGGVRSLEVDPSGIRIVADVGVRADAPLPERVRLGSLIRGGTLGAMSASPGVSASASLDSLDQTLFATWAAGVLRKRYDRLTYSGTPVTVGTLAVVVPAIRGLAPADAPIIIDVEALLPPVLSDGDSRVEVRFPDFQTAIRAVVGGREVTLFTLSLSALGTAAPALRDGAFGIEMAHVDVIADVVTGPEGMPQGPRLDTLLHELLGDVFTRMLDFSPFRIPEIVGFSIVPSTVSVSGGYIRFDASLRYGATTTPPPG